MKGKEGGLERWRADGGRGITGRKEGWRDGRREGPKSTQVTLRETFPCPCPALCPPTSPSKPPLCPPQPLCPLHTRTPKPVGASRKGGDNSRDPSSDTPGDTPMTTPRGQGMRDAAFIVNRGN